MVRGIAWTLSILAVALGGVHLALTPANYPHPSTDAMWFVGSGVALVVAGLLNVVALRAAASDWLARGIALAVNAAFALGFVYAWTLLQGPQVIVGVALFAGLALTTLLRRS